MTGSDLQSHPSGLRASALPVQPAPAAQATSLAALLDHDLARFAMTFDGYAQFGERWSETLRARHEEWERDGTLPRDIGALRGLLSLTFREERFVELDAVGDASDAAAHGAGGVASDRITNERRQHEAFKHAILARLRELVDAAEAAERN